MSLDKDRFDESRKMISEYLVKEHDDGDGDSLFCRFSEISQAYQDVICSDAALDRFLASYNERRQKLWELCSDFVKHYGILCDETLDKDDIVPMKVKVKDAYSLIGEIVKIVDWRIGNVEESGCPGGDSGSVED